MKSLEIINGSIEYIEFVLKYDGGIDNEQKKLLESSLEKSKQIKADLEVLEIIRKKKVDVPLLERIIKGHSFDQAILDIYNLATNSQLTLEELLKLKQWLEECDE